MASVAHLEERRFGVSNPMWPLKTGKPEMTKSGNSVQNGNSVQSGNSVQKEDSNRKKTKCSYRPVSYTHKDTGLRLALVSFRSQTASGPGSQFVKSLLALGPILVNATITWNYRAMSSRDKVSHYQPDRKECHPKRCSLLQTVTSPAFCVVTRWGALCWCCD
ncbi:uncharacterized protein YALI1_D07896g [Yarrowia lipolytica]|uniref:Uncharacterized protein n=1 Tax=Yarrowia lipolytica TaxID=4952 RepID=A0A1D8NDE2_YARLL|nr:hypothetical protein YALI1_D07896g [Yarrowia lipolytica]